MVLLDLYGLTGKGCHFAAEVGGYAPRHRFDDATGQFIDLAARGANPRLLIGEADKELLFFRISASTKRRDRIEVTVQPQVMLENKPWIRGSHYVIQTALSSRAEICLPLFRLQTAHALLESVEHFIGSFVPS